MTRTLASLSLLALLSLTFATPAHSASSFDGQMSWIHTDYRLIYDALAADRLDASVARAAEAIAKQSKVLDLSAVPEEQKEHYAHLPQQLVDAATSLAGAKDLAAARSAMKALSRPMAMWVSMSKPDGVEVMYCPMEKASWLQAAGETRNPYVGPNMRSCGQPVGGVAPAEPKHGHDQAHGHHDGMGH